MKTVLQELIDLLEEEIAFYCTEDFIDCGARLGLEKSIIIAKGLLLKEKQQIKNAFVEGEHQQGFEDEAEQYYKESYISE